MLKLRLQLKLQPHNCVYHHAKARQYFDIKNNNRKEINRNKNTTVIKNKKKHVDKYARKNGADPTENTDPKTDKP